MSKSENRIRKVKRANRACDNCRKRKIKCSGFSPCLNCIASGLTCDEKQSDLKTGERFFKSPSKLSHDVSSLKESLVGFLDQISAPDSQKLKESVKNAITALDNVDVNSFLQMRYENLETYNDSKSIESGMIRKPYLLNRFYPDAGSGNDPPISRFFGIYSPLVHFSPLGISYIIKALLQSRDDRSVRETIYLLLKFLDVSTATYIKSESSASEASEKGIDMCAQIERLLDALPHDISERLGCLDRRHPKTFNEKLLFCTQLFQSFQEETVKEELGSCTLGLYLEATETLSGLCRESCRLSVSADVTEEPLTENLLNMIERTYWTCSFVTMGKSIAHTCRRVLDEGLNRWEYNLGIQEKVADSKRKLWWRCYWWDRWYAISTGKPPLLSDEASNCLFPLDVLHLHVNDEMDCLTLVREVELKQSNLESCLQFGYILLSKTISFAFSSILYNREFTAYKSYASDKWKNSSVTLASLRGRNDILNETFRLIEEKICPILLSNINDRRCLELFIHTKMTTACISQALCGLFRRLEKCLVNKQLPLLNDMIDQNSRGLFETSRSALLEVLKLKNNKILAQNTSPIPIFMLNITSQLISGIKKGSISDESFLFNISVMCGVCERFDEFVNVSKIESIGIRFLQDRLSLTASSCFIFTRMCCQVYMGIRDRTKEQFIMELQDVSIENAGVAQKVLDIKSSLFVNLLKSYQQSSFSQCILRHNRIKMEDLKVAIGPESPESRPNSIDHQSAPSVKPAWTLGDSELDIFTSTEDQLDLLNSLWDEAFVKHYDYFNRN